MKKWDFNRGMVAGLLLLLIVFSVWARIRERSIRAEYEQERVGQSNSKAGFVRVGIK